MNYPCAIVVPLASPVRPAATAEIVIRDALKVFFCFNIAIFK